MTDSHCYSKLANMIRIQWALAYSSLMSTVLLFALDNTIVGTYPRSHLDLHRILTGLRKVATIQPTIVETFGHQEDLAWIGVSFVLGQSLILPMYVREDPYPSPNSRSKCGYTVENHSACST